MLSEKLCRRQELGMAKSESRHTNERHVIRVLLTPIHSHSFRFQRQQAIS